MTERHNFKQTNINKELSFKGRRAAKGAFPNYIAHGVIAGFPEQPKVKGLAHVLASPVVRGLFTWSRGGQGGSALALATFGTNAQSSKQEWLFFSHAEMRC